MNQVSGLLILIIGTLMLPSPALAHHGNLAEHVAEYAYLWIPVMLMLLLLFLRRLLAQRISHLNASSSATVITSDSGTDPGLRKRL